MSAKSLSDTIIEQLTDHLLRPVTENSRAKARLHLIDWIGCAVIGATEPAGKILLNSKARLNNGEVFALGGLGNILEMDDIEKLALLHPGPCIIPAAIKCANDQNVSLDELLDAIVIGYEATIRLGRALGVNHYANWHSTGTCGTIGAAASCAALLNLDFDQVCHTLALAVSQTAGFWQTRHETESMGKQLHTAHAARAGYESAELARLGFKGPLTVIEGEQGLFAATAPRSDPNAILAHSLADWLICRVSFKPWAACRHVHSAIDAALQIRLIGFDKSARICVTTYRDALKFCDNPDPQSVVEAKFSLQHSVAVALMKGVPQLEDFSSSAINDPEIARLRQRVTVEVGKDFDQRYPSQFGARVSANDLGIVVLDALGDPENPMTSDQILGKAITLMNAKGLDSQLIEKICRSVVESETEVKYLYKRVWEALL